MPSINKNWTTIANMMKFKLLGDVIPSITINLAALRRDTQRYSMLLYQHEGELFASKNRIGNLDQALAGNQVQSFFNLLKEKNVDLGVTPEYVVPWDTLRELLTQPDNFPKPNKLWALGMESIDKEKLQEFDEFCTELGVYFHYDKSVLEENQNFLNTLIYLFQAEIDGDKKLVVLAQFKTRHMGVWVSDLERNNMIGGKEIYILKNNNSSVRLFSVICSEAMNFPGELSQEVRDTISWGDAPYMILNPQVNSGPIHKNFLDFRNTVLEMDRKQVVELNWTNNSKIMGQPLIKEGASRSGIFMRAADFDFKGIPRINKNHAQGMYYFYSGKDRHAFLLDSKAHAFLIENTSVHILDGTPAQQRHNGPEVMGTFRLEKDFSWNVIERVSDGHIDFLNELECKNEFLLDPKNCVMEKERLVCLSSGEIPDKSDLHWADVEKLSSLRFADTTEINNRITVAQDTSAESLNKRSYYAKAITKLEGSILKVKDLYPRSLDGLKSKNIRVGYAQLKNDDHKKIIEEHYYRYNITTVEGEMVSATICFLPLGGRKAASLVYEKLRKLFTKDSMANCRVVVYFETPDGYDCISDINSGSIVSDSSASEASFNK
jgi:hypothetical protein